MNDRSELQRFGLILRDFITPKIKEIFDNRALRESAFAKRISSDGGIDKVTRRVAAMHVDNLHRTTFGESAFPGPFMCSFCAHKAGSYETFNGLLSQWRGYGAGGGIAAVFDTKGIELKMKYEHDTFAHPINHIGDVKYDNDKHGIKKEYSKLFERFEKWLVAFYSQQEPMGQEMLQPFILGSTLVKHHGFHEEREVRIVVSPTVQER